METKKYGDKQGLSWARSTQTCSAGESSQDIAGRQGGRVRALVDLKPDRSLEITW